MGIVLVTLGIYPWIENVNGSLCDNYVVNCEVNSVTKLSIMNKNNDGIEK